LNSSCRRNNEFKILKYLKISGGLDKTVSEEINKKALIKERKKNREKA